MKEVELIAHASLFKASSRKIPSNQMELVLLIWSIKILSTQVINMSGTTFAVSGTGLLMIQLELLSTNVCLTNLLPMKQDLKSAQKPQFTTVLRVAMSTLIDPRIPGISLVKKFLLVDTLLSPGPLPRPLLSLLLPQ